MKISFVKGATLLLVASFMTFAVDAEVAQADIAKQSLVCSTLKGRRDFQAYSLTTELAIGSECNGKVFIVVNKKKKLALYRNNQRKAIVKLILGTNVDLSGVSGAPGAQGIAGVAGKDGAVGPQGPAGPDGSDVSGVLRSCYLEGFQGVYNDPIRAGYCYLEGTSFTFRHLFGQDGEQESGGDNESIVNDDAPFTFYHVPAGTYTLNCDIEAAECERGYKRGYSKKQCRARIRTTTSVTAPADGTVNVGTIDLCDADGDGFTTPLDCNDLSSKVNPDAYDDCNGSDDNCDGIIDENCMSSSSSSSESSN